MNPGWTTFVATLCRGSDPDRSAKFAQAARALSAEGCMADLDDGPEQLPLEPELVRATLRSLLAERSFDLVLTHAPRGEYTRHLRHEEVSAAVLELWSSGELAAAELWLFAYEDGGRSYLPRAIPEADLTLALPHDIWLEKARLISQVYGFGADSWEAQVTPRSEAFWRASARAPMLTPAET
jgi:LmbE family N-acetylglucosaminyl deacetylase